MTAYATWFEYGSANSPNLLTSRLRRVLSGAVLETKNPKQLLVEQLDADIPELVTKARIDGMSWDDITVDVNSRLADTGVHVKVSRESLRAWYGRANP